MATSLTPLQRIIQSEAEKRLRADLFSLYMGLQNPMLQYMKFKQINGEIQPEGSLEELFRVDIRYADREPYHLIKGPLATVLFHANIGDYVEQVTIQLVANNKETFKHTQPKPDF
jgi:hypothetical protein